jgi:hypothetical protein
MLNHWHATLHGIKPQKTISITVTAPRTLTNTTHSNLTRSNFNMHQHKWIKSKAGPGIKNVHIQCMPFHLPLTSNIMNEVYTSPPT